MYPAYVDPIAFPTCLPQYLKDAVKKVLTHHLCMYGFRPLRLTECVGIWQSTNVSSFCRSNSISNMPATVFKGRSEESSDSSSLHVRLNVTDASEESDLGMNNVEVALIRLLFTPFLSQTRKLVTYLNEAHSSTLKNNTLPYMSSHQQTLFGRFNVYVHVRH